jgi:hypothetical protein
MSDLFYWWLYHKTELFYKRLAYKDINLYEIYSDEIMNAFKKHLETLYFIGIASFKKHLETLYDDGMESIKLDSVKIQTRYPDTIDEIPDIKYMIEEYFNENLDEFYENIKEPEPQTEDEVEDMEFKEFSEETKLRLIEIDEMILDLQTEKRIIIEEDDTQPQTVEVTEKFPE